jgi:hypothetical protein
MHMRTMQSVIPAGLVALFGMAAGCLPPPAAPGAAVRPEPVAPAPVQPAPLGRPLDSVAVLANYAKLTNTTAPYEQYVTKRGFSPPLDEFKQRADLAARVQRLKAKEAEAISAPYHSVLVRVYLPTYDFERKGFLVELRQRMFDLSGGRLLFYTPDDFTQPTLVTNEGVYELELTNAKEFAFIPVPEERAQLAVAGDSRYALVELQVQFTGTKRETDAITHLVVKGMIVRSRTTTEKGGLLIAAVP